MAESNATYYAHHDFAADFATAPEITQVFGEILGLWAAVTWQQMGSPARFVLAEAGPGRGTLMADALRAAGRVPGFAQAAALHLVETSPRLRAIQSQRLTAIWHDRIEHLPDGPMILLGNEFLDALPIRQLVRRGRAWAERFVANGAFIEQPAEAPERDAAEGEIVEIGEAARAIAHHLGTRLATQGGAALFLDYGPTETTPGDSLQALKGGQPADPLADPGTADLTAHVDFQAFARAAPCAVHGPMPQGKFLIGLGLFQRSFALARTLPPREGAALVEAAKRLAEPDQMGRLFKAIALCHPALPTPAGFEA